MFSPRTLTISLLSVALVLLACGSDEESPTETETGGPPPATMVGSWTYQSVTVDGNPANLSDELEWVPGTAAARVHIQANGAYVYEEVNSGGGQLWFQSGFVYVDGNEVDINAQLDSDGPASGTQRRTFTLSGDTMTLRDVSGGMTTVFTLTR